MDTSNLIIKYSDGDFADAFRALLPKGEYWQETENKELNDTVLGIGAEFKKTHDEIELSLTAEVETTTFGWKLADYRELLIRVTNVSGNKVYDEFVNPNLIKVSLLEEVRHKAMEAWQAFEEKRLPHTDITWIYNTRIDVKHQLANCRHILNVHKYKVTE